MTTIETPRVKNETPLTDPVTAMAARVAATRAFRRELVSEQGETGAGHAWDCSGMAVRSCGRAAAATAACVHVLCTLRALHAPVHLLRERH